MSNESHFNACCERQDRAKLVEYKLIQEYNTSDFNNSINKYLKNGFVFCKNEGPEILYTKRFGEQIPQLIYFRSMCKYTFRENSRSDLLDELIVMEH